MSQIEQKFESPICSDYAGGADDNGQFELPTVRGGGDPYRLQG